MPWGAAVGAIIGVAGSALADDHGAEGMNDASAALSREQARISREQDARYKEMYLPIEREFLEEGRRAGGIEEQEERAGQANADVTQSFERLRRENEMRGNAAGFTGGSPNVEAGRTTLGIAEAGTRAGAMTTARRDAIDEGYNKRFGIVQLGKGMPGEAAYGIGSASRRFGELGENAYARTRQDAADIGYLAAPFSKKAGEWFNNRMQGSGIQKSTVVDGGGGTGGSYRSYGGSSQVIQR